MIQRILYCEGKNYELGRCQGELLSSEIRENLLNFWNIMKNRGYQYKELLRTAISRERLLGTNRLEEINGISDGSGVEYPEILAYNLFHDLAFSEECTVLMAVGNASATGDTIFLKNSDKVGSESYIGPNSFKNKEINVIILLRPKEGNKIIGVSSAGTTALKMGLNDKGVATGSNISRTKELALKGAERDSTKIKALDRGALMREGLEKGKTALEASQAILPGLLENPMSTPGNIEFADAKEAIIIEGSYHEMATEIVRDDVAARSNCFVILKALNREDDVSSICRYVRCLKLLGDNKGKITRDKMIEFSMDHVNGPGPNSICRHGVHFSEETSLSAAVMEIDGKNPERSRITICLGKPCRAWRSEEAHITLNMEASLKDIPEGLLSGETWRKFYTEEPMI